MSTNLIPAIINSLIILMVVCSFSIIGQIINHKYFDSRFKYDLPIGFATYIASFQIFSFPFILVQTKFSTFLICFIFFVIAWLIFILINRSHLQFRLFKSGWQFHLLIVIFVVLIISSKSLIYSDNWLYSTMITSTIQNNSIYSHNGLLSNIQLSLLHHRFESYYLWQATLSMLFQGKYILVLITEYKLFDACLLVATFLELGHQFKFSRIKNAMFTFTLFCMLIAQGAFLNISPFQTSEPPVQLFQISTGTALYHYYLIPLAIIYLKVESKLTSLQKNLFLIGTLVAFSGLSTTFYYTMPLYYIAILTIKHCFQKQLDVEVLHAFLISWLLIGASFIGVETMSIPYVFGFVVAYLLITRLIIYIYQKIAPVTYKYITLFIYSAYAIIAIVLFNPMMFIGHDFTTDKQALRIYNLYIEFVNGNYQKIILPVVCLILVMYVLFKIFTSEKYNFFSQYILVYSMLFLNPFALILYKFIGVEPVISRIYAFSFIGYLIIIKVFESKPLSIPKLLLVIWLSVAIGQIISNIDANVKSKATQITAVNSNFNQLANYEFEPNSFVVFDNLDATVGSEVYYTGVNKIVILNTNISWDPSITSCDKLATSEKYQDSFQHCYTIYDRDKSIDAEYEFDTEKYLIYKNY